MLRRCAADFSNGREDGCDMELVISENAECLTLEVDEALMARAMDNLLNNSFRHNPDGCAITVRAEAADGELALAIRDNGPGYPEHVLQLLNGKTPRNDVNAPYILGLHLVRQIVQAHGGRVEFRNERGAVAVIRLKIPD